jgi:hypothetical protein
MSAIQTNLQGLLQKEVSRKEFLTIAGLALLSIFGFSTVIKLLTGKSVETHHLLSGYGSTMYGGTKKKGSL